VTYTFLSMSVYYLLMNIHAELTILDGGYYGTLFVSFLYICTNPFIYATNFDPVKKVLLSLVPCKKPPVQPIALIQVAASGTSAKRTIQSTKLQVSHMREKKMTTIHV